MTPDAELPQLIKNFISLEECSLTRDAVIERFKHIYYSSGAYPTVNPDILDSSVRLILERRHIYFDDPSLRRVTPCSSGIKALKGISPKSGYDYESS